MSPYDDQAHAFIESANGGPSSAPHPCHHSAPTDRLTDNIDNAPKCVTCLLVVGEAMADRVEHDAGAMLERQRAQLREDAERDVTGLPGFDQKPWPRE